MKKSFLLGLAAMLLPLTSWAQDDAEKKFSVEITNALEGKITYDGDATKPNISVKVDGADATAGEYAIKYFKVEEDTPTQIPSTEVRNVGKYQIEVSSNGDKYFGYEPKTVLFEVTHKVITTLTISDENLTREYDGTTDDKIDLSNFITDVTGLGTGVNEKADFLKCLYLKRTEGVNEVNVGGSTIRVEVSQKEGETGSNYKYDATGRTINVPLTITPRKLALTFSGREYKVLSGEPFETKLDVLAAAENDAWKFDEGKVVAKDEGKVKISLEVVKPAADAKLINVGTYELKPTVIGEDETAKNYTFAEDYTSEYKISQAKLTIARNEEKKAEKTYGSDDPDLYELFTYTVNFPSANTPLEITKEKTFGVNITRTEGENVQYDEEEKNVIPYYAITIDGGENFDIVGYEDKSTKLQINPLKLNSDENKEGAEASANIIFAQPKKEIIYAGVDFVATKPEIEGLTLTTKDLDIESKNGYKLQEGTDYTLVYSAQPAGTAMNAGEKFNITILGKGNYSGGLWSLGYEIKKAPLAINKKDGAVFKRIGNVKPDYLKLFDFVDFVGKDIEDPSDVLSQFSIGSQSGLIKLNTDNIKNYEVEYTPVTMLTLENSFTLYGDDYVAVSDGNEETKAEYELHNTTVLEQYSGLTVPTVKIENLRGLRTQKFTYGKYYSLVLPFEIDVRELSEQLGYAVVNIPNTNNDDPETIKFGLTITKVPANTMMLFRVDGNGIENNESLDDISLTFTEKEIVKNLNPNPEFAEDNANHKFMITYEAYELSGEDEYYWAPTGVFNSAKDYEAAYGEYMVINAFNGYFVFDSKNNIARSIEFGELDGSTTSIDLVTGETARYGAEGWYTIGGMKLNAQPTEKGIYINNGKKVVIK